jgi:hypothetical protein
MVDAAARPRRGAGRQPLQHLQRRRGVPEHDQHDLGAPTAAAGCRRDSAPSSASGSRTAVQFNPDVMTGP